MLRLQIREEKGKNYSDCFKEGKVFAPLTFEGSCNRKGLSAEFTCAA